MQRQTKVAIIQLTRIGDLVQTLQAARQFKAENPDVELTLIARSKFAKGIKFLLETVFDKFYLFETKDFFIEKSFDGALSEVNSFLSEINSNNFDMLVNLSFSKASAYLANSLNAKVKFGLLRNNKNEIAIQDKWSQFVYSNVMTHGNSPFTLVDIYRYILGVKENLVLTTDQSHKRSNSIVIHPFASQKKKRWGMNKWSELIYKLAKDHPDFTFHIVGGNEDTKETSRLLHTPALQKYKDRIFGHAGKKNIGDVYQLLDKANLFIGHDSMVSHLASETLTPSIIISLGTVRPFETTPYSEHVYNVVPKNDCFSCTIEKTCELLPCHSSINYQVIANLAEGIIKNQVINKTWVENTINTFHLNSIKIFKSEYSEDGLQLNEITNNFHNISDTFRNYYRIIWLYYLRGIETKNTLPKITKETAIKLHQYIKGVEYLYELYNFGVKYSNKIIEASSDQKADIKIIKENIQRIGEIDQLCDITKKSYPELKALVNFFYVNKANAIGDNLVDISKSNLLNYYDASNLVAVLGDFIEKSVSPHIEATGLDKEV